MYSSTEVPSTTLISDSYPVVVSLQQGKKISRYARWCWMMRNDTQSLTGVLDTAHIYWSGIAMEALRHPNAMHTVSSYRVRSTPCTSQKLYSQSGAWSGEAFAMHGGSGARWANVRWTTVRTCMQAVSVVGGAWSDVLVSISPTTKCLGIAD